MSSTNSATGVKVTRAELSAMCRFCLSSNIARIDIFRFSNKIKNSPADVIMKCTPVQISKDDEMPNFICPSCYTHLQKTHQFLMQVEQCDKTLRRYLQLLYASDKPIKADCSVQSISLNPHDVLDLNWKQTEAANFNQENKNNEIYLKSEIKVEPIDVNLFLTTECEAGPEDILSNIDDKELSCQDSKIGIGKTKVSEDMIANWKEKEQENNILTNKCMEEIYLKSEVYDEKIDDNFLIPTESVVVNASSNGDGNNISREDTKINIGHAAENSGFSFASITENISKCYETNKNIPVNRKKHKKSNNLKSYLCDICNRCFHRKSLLNLHKSIHTGEKPYKCNFCDKCFARSEYLKKHKLIHTGEKPYQCNICNKCFSRCSHLNRHKLIHTGEKPYQCDVCAKYFNDRSSLIRHKITHTGEKPYKCNFCKKCFTTSEYLKKHKQMHTGEKPYKCNICNQCFSQSSNLNTHKLKHTDEKPYQCDVCNKCFSQSSKLNDHKLVHS